MANKCFLCHLKEASVDNILIKCKKGFLDFIVFLVWCVVDASSLVSETLLGCQGPFRGGGGKGCGGLLLDAYFGQFEFF